MCQGVELVSNDPSHGDQSGIAIFNVEGGLKLLGCGGINFDADLANFICSLGGSRQEIHVTSLLYYILVCSSTQYSQI